MMKKTTNEATVARRGARHAFELVRAALAIALLAAACSPLQRHAALDLVFDGVPPYRTPEERDRLKAEALESAGREQPLARRAARGRGREKQEEKFARFVHGPFAVKECERCHDLSIASGFRKPSTGGASSAAAKADLAEGGRLRMPVVELCVHCHTDFAADAPANAGLWMHGPVANGLCVACHQAHSSPYAALVAKDPRARLCGQCHAREDLVAFTPEHRPVGPEDAYPPPAAHDRGTREGADAEAEPPPETIRVVANCTRCHDPHRGAERTLLKARSEWGPEPLRELEPAPDFLLDPEGDPEPDAGPELSRAERSL